MQVAKIRELFRRCTDYTVAEITYKNQAGVLTIRTCFLNPFNNAIHINSFEDVPPEYRDDLKKTYRELPCLTVALSLDKNYTGYHQPFVNVLPKDVHSIELLALYTNEEDENEFSNSVQIRTRNPGMNTQTVAGYLVHEGDLQRILKQEEIRSICIASFIEKGEQKEILTVEPVIDISALVRNKKT